MKRKNKSNNLEKTIYLIFFLIAESGLIYGTIQFWIGFHNSDLVFNYQYLLTNLKTNYTIDSFYEQYNSNGDMIKARDLYIVGREQERRGILLVGISSFALGMIIVNLLKEQNATT